MVDYSLFQMSQSQFLLPIPLGMTLHCSPGLNPLGPFYRSNFRHHVECNQWRTLRKVSATDCIHWPLIASTVHCPPPSVRHCIKIRIQALKIRIQALKIRIRAFKIRIQALKIRIQALKIRIQALKIRVRAFKIRIQALKIRIQALKIRIQAFKIRIQALKKLRI